MEILNRKSELLEIMIKGQSACLNKRGNHHPPKLQCIFSYVPIISNILIPTPPNDTLMVTLSDSLIKEGHIKQSQGKVIAKFSDIHLLKRTSN
jgi:hypothetical protein